MCSRIVCWRCGWRRGLRRTTGSKHTHADMSMRKQLSVLYGLSLQNAACIDPNTLFYIYTPCNCMASSAHCNSGARSAWRARSPHYDLHGLTSSGLSGCGSLTTDGPPPSLTCKKRKAWALLGNCSHLLSGCVPRQAMSFVNLQPQRTCHTKPSCWV